MSKKFLKLVAQHPVPYSMCAEREDGSRVCGWDDWLLELVVNHLDWELAHSSDKIEP
jgi:hypothetical protein